MHGVRSLILALLAAVGAGFAMSPHEEVHTCPDGFVLHGPAHPETRLDLRIALRQNDIAGLETVFLDISNPDSPQYGRHLSQQQVDAYVEPSIDTTANVHRWLSSHNLTASNVSHAGDWIQVSVPVGKANNMLNANFSHFSHAKTGGQAIRTLTYSIPTELQSHIDLVHPTVDFSSFTLPISADSTHRDPSVVTRSQTFESLPASCQDTITPTCIMDLYGIPRTLATQPSNNLYVTGISAQWANRADLKAFLEANRPDLNSSTTFRDESANGGTNSQNRTFAGYEANLDVQYTVGIASGVAVTYLSIGPNTVFNGFTDFLLNETHYLLGQKKVPNTLTTSYGADEAGWSQKLVTSVCNTYMQLGARGTSVIFSSGDNGVGFGCDNASFIPTFPSNCPYVTAVGATQLHGSTEVAAGLSSGGFSNVFHTPSYQSAAVSSYIHALGSKYAGRYNASGRGIPDVSALGINYLIEARGTTTHDNGTSCAAPVFASVIAKLNDELISKGRPPLGFLNPFLYSAKGSAAFNDITSGSNPGCGTDGFPAKNGWDPVTGLGTPSFAKLKIAVGL